MVVTKQVCRRDYRLRETLTGMSMRVLGDAHSVWRLRDGAGRLVSVHDSRNYALHKARGILRASVFGLSLP